MTTAEYYVGLNHSPDQSNAGLLAYIVNNIPFSVVSVGNAYLNGITLATGSWQGERERVAILTIEDFPSEHSFNAELLADAFGQDAVIAVSRDAMAGGERVYRVPLTHSASNWTRRDGHGQAAYEYRTLPEWAGQSNLYMVTATRSVGPGDRLIAAMNTYRNGG